MATSATSTPLAFAIAPRTVKITKPEKKLVRQSIKGTIRASLCFKKNKKIALCNQLCIFINILLGFLFLDNLLLFCMFFHIYIRQTNNYDLNAEKLTYRKQKLSNLLKLAIKTSPPEHALREKKTCVAASLQTCSQCLIYIASNKTFVYNISRVLRLYFSPMS